MVDVKVKKQTSKSNEIHIHPDVTRIWLDTKTVRTISVCYLNKRGKVRQRQLVITEKPAITLS